MAVSGGGLRGIFAKCAIFPARGRETGVTEGIFSAILVLPDRLLRQKGRAIMSDSSFFSNRSCEFFPCHAGADPERFNCLFCFCPLYVLGDRCGGTFTFLENGVKDCSSCLFPHHPEHYADILRRFPEIAARMPKPGGDT